MARGEVLWFDPERGFGFLRPELGPRDVFVHASALVGMAATDLRRGAWVEFEMIQSGNGRLLARRVTLVKPPDRGSRQR